MKQKILNNELGKNINRNYVYIFMQSFDLTSGIWMLYLAFKGLSLFEIGLMESVYHLSSFLMEIPTGIVADIYGRKTSRMLGRVANIVSTLILIFSGNIYMFALSFCLTALGNNLESGAGDALIYDSMKENHDEDNYMKVKGRQEIFFQLARSMSLIVGGYLGTLDYALVYKGALIVGVVAFLQSLTFKEPTIGKIQVEDNIIKTFIGQLKTSTKIVLSDFRIGFLIISIEILATFTTTEFFYVQNHLKSIGRNELQIGIILSCGAVAAIIAATNTYKLEKKIKFKGIFLVVPMAGIVGLWGVSIPGLTEVSIVLITAVEGILFVSTSDYINRLIPSEQRATILSFQSMMFSLFMILLFPVVGILGDAYGLMFAFRVIAGISTVILTVLMIIVRFNPNIEVN